MWKDEVMIFNTGQGSLKGQDVKCIRRSKFFGKIWLRFLKYRFTSSVGFGPDCSMQSVGQNHVDDSVTIVSQSCFVKLFLQRSLYFV